MRSSNKSKKNNTYFFLLWAIALCSLYGSVYGATATVDIDSQATIEIKYPSFNDNFVRDYEAYFLRLLKLGMDKSGRPYRLRAQPVSTYGENRSQLRLLKNQYNLHWLNTNPEREDRLRAIPIPIFKGLIGWRLLLIDINRQAQFAKVNSLDDLRKLKATQGHDWPDVAILTHNQLPVTTSANREGLFKMLGAGRVDYFPRSIMEIWREQQTFASLNLSIEPHLVLHYPAAYYFFTNKENPELAEALSLGLSRAIADGSFDQLFMEYFGDYLHQAQLNKRRIIELVNPDLDASLHPEYWYNPKTSKKINSSPTQ
jgi:hypothetical protein